MDELDSRVEEFDCRVEEFESQVRRIRGRGVKEYSRRVDEFALLGHRTYQTNRDRSPSKGPLSQVHAITVVSSRSSSVLPELALQLASQKPA